MQHYEVKRISRVDFEPYIMHIHYARRWPSITWAFGLFEDGVLCGIVAYGTPPSPTLRKHLAGINNERFVIELNRLCLRNNKKNEASILVGRSIKMLPPNKVIVSYADNGQNHVGCVYQATNFLYTGLSVDATEYKVRGKPKLHNMTILDEFRGCDINRVAALKEKYGNAVYVARKTRKHRYVYLHGNRKFKKRILEDLRYPIQKYPKGVDTIQDLESVFSDKDNIENTNLAEQLSSKDFEDLII